MCKPRAGVLRRGRSDAAGRAFGRGAHRPPHPAAGRPSRRSRRRSTSVIEKRTGLHDTHVAAGTLSMVQRVEAPIVLRQPDRGVPRCARTGRPDGRRDARRFLVAGRDATTLAGAVFAGRVDDLAPGRSATCSRSTRAGTWSTTGCSARSRTLVLLTSTSAAPNAWDARLRRVVRTARTARHECSNRTLEPVRSWWPVRARATGGGLPEDPIDAASLPYPGHRELNGRRRRLPAIRSASSASSPSSCTTTLERPELWTNRWSGADGTWGLAVRARDARSCFVWRRVTSTSARTRSPTTPRPARARPVRRHDQAVGSWARRAPTTPCRAPTDPKGSRAGLRGRSRRRRTAGRAAHTSAPTSSVASPRPNAPPLLDRAIGLGLAPASRDGFPNELRAGDAVARVVPTTVLRTRRHEGPW